MFTLISHREDEFNGRIWQVAAAACYLKGQFPEFTAAAMNIVQIARTLRTGALNFSFFTEKYRSTKMLKVAKKFIFNLIKKITSACVSANDLDVW